MADYEDPYGHEQLSDTVWDGGWGTEGAVVADITSGADGVEPAPAPSESQYSDAQADGDGDIAAPGGDGVLDAAESTGKMDIEFVVRPSTVSRRAPTPAAVSDDVIVGDEDPDERADPVRAAAKNVRRPTRRRNNANGSLGALGMTPEEQAVANATAKAIANAPTKTEKVAIQTAVAKVTSQAASAKSTGKAFDMNAAIQRAILQARLSAPPADTPWWKSKFAIGIGLVALGGAGWFAWARWGGKK